MHGVQHSQREAQSQHRQREAQRSAYKLQLVVVQGDSADSMLSWVMEQQGQDAVMDPNLAKQVTLAVLRHAIPNPKVDPPPPPPLCFGMQQPAAMVHIGPIWMWQVNQRLLYS